MLSAIVAVGNNNVIGGNNKLLWHLPEDLNRFKKITEGNVIIMGRKTFESLPKILSNRFHVILTRDRDYRVLDERVKVINSIDKLHSLIDSEDEVFVIGGGEIYSLLLPYTKRIYLTKIYEDFKGDTFFPNIDSKEWNIISEKSGYEGNIAYEFFVINRNKEIKNILTNI